MISEQAIQIIIGHVGEVMGVEDMRSRSHVQNLVSARSVTCYLLRRSGLTLQAIGELFGQHHTSVMYSVRKIEQERKNYPTIDALVSRLEKTFEDLDARLGVGK